MRTNLSVACLLGAVILTAGKAAGQIPNPGPDFGNNLTQLREVTSAELACPAIPVEQIGDPNPDPQFNENDRPPNPNAWIWRAGTPPNPLPVRPLYLVLRYYSVVPWYPTHVRSVYTDAVQNYAYQIDTGGARVAGDNVDAQIVRDINHPAYGLYCVRIIICVPRDQWGAQTLLRRFWVKWAYGHPYWCWHDHWWYYWQHPCTRLELTPGQEVPTPQIPPTGPIPAGKATVCVQANGTVTYQVSFTNMTSGVTAAHFHGAAFGATAPPIASATLALGTAAGLTSGSFSGTLAPNATLLNALATNTCYINLHTTINGPGEIRGQVAVISPGPTIWCPWGPSWWPYLSWSRISNFWCLSITHPYCYRWHPLWTPRAWCLYGLRHYFVPIVNVRSPVIDDASPNAVPVISRLSNNQPPGTLTWATYPSVVIGGQPILPLYRYWPYTPYATRWYWWRCTPFPTYRYIPPVVQFAIWQNPDGTDVAPQQDFPLAPVQESGTGTVGVFASRAITSQPGDITGDGAVNTQDLASIKQQLGTQSLDSFFDIFVEVSSPDM